MKTLLLVMALLVSGCTRSIDVNTKPVEREPLNIKSPAPIEVPNLYIRIITDKSADAKLSALKEPVMFCFDGEDMKEATHFLNDVLTYITLQNQILQSYRTYYEPH